MFFQPNVSQRVWAWIYSAGRKEHWWLVGWFGRRETRLPSGQPPPPHPPKKRCEGFKCQWLPLQLLAALVATDISPDCCLASLLFNVSLLRFVYLFILFYFVTFIVTMFVFTASSFQHPHFTFTDSSDFISLTVRVWETCFFFLIIFQRQQNSKLLFWFMQPAGWSSNTSVIHKQRAGHWSASELRCFIFRLTMPLLRLLQASNTI